VDLAESKKGTELGEKALHTAFATYREKRDPVKLKEIGEKLLADYPNSTLGADVLATLGKNALEAADFEGAASRYEELYKRFSKDGTAIEALKVAAETREQLGDYPKALDDLGKLYADPGYKQRATVQFKIAELKFKSGDIAGAQSLAEATLAADATNGKAAALLGRCLLAQNKVTEAETRLNALIKPIVKATRTAGAEADSAAEVYFLLGEALFKEFTALGAKDLEKKAGAVGTLEQAYTAAARLGTGTWAVGGLYRLGLAYANLSSDVLQTPTPPGADPAQVKAILQQQSQALTGKAEEFYGACLRKARDLEVYNAYALGCAQKAVVDENAMGAPSGTADANLAQSPKEALAKNPNDYASLLQLGGVYLQGGDFRRARLTFSRATQVDSAKAEGFAGLGLAMVKLGESTDAHDAYAKAIEVDPQTDLAHADMAALKCRFGDIEGAKAELAKLHGPPEATPALDPDWAKCK
jgi:tetratricopeptide (TPR) repeat protein